jgi:hypothetical protein
VQAASRDWFRDRTGADYALTLAHFSVAIALSVCLVACARPNRPDDQSERISREVTVEILPDLINSEAKKRSIDLVVSIADVEIIDGVPNLALKFAFLAKPKSGDDFCDFMCPILGLVRDTVGRLIERGRIQAGVTLLFLRDEQGSVVEIPTPVLSAYVRGELSDQAALDKILIRTGYHPRTSSPR